MYEERRCCWERGANIDPDFRNTGNVLHKNMSQKTPQVINVKGYSQ
jgi:hypothetical protein